MRHLTRALTTLALLFAGPFGVAPAHAATPELYVYTSTSGDFGQEQTNLTRWRNFIGAKEAGWVLFNDYTGTAQSALGNVSYGLGLAKAHGATGIVYSIPLAYASGMSLADAAAGKNDANYTAEFKLIAAAYPGSDVRLGWEEDGEWYLWSATTHDAALFVQAYTRVSALAKAQGLRPWFNPGIGRPANAGDPGPTVAPDMAFDVYLSAPTAGGVTTEPQETAAMFADWWAQNTLTSYYPGRTKAVWEYGSTGDDATYVAASLKQFVGMGLQKLGVWDSSASYAGTISDGSQPASAIEYLKVFGPAAIKAQLAGASLYKGSAIKAAPPAGYHAVLAQLASGDVEQLAWGDQVGQTNQATVLTPVAKAAVAPAVAVTSISPAGATASVAPNADGSEVITLAFPTTSTAVDYVFTLAAPRQLGFATTDGKLSGYTWQGGRDFTTDDWRASGGTARIWVGAK